MKRFALAVAGIILLAACGESDVPIDDLANAPFDSSVVGIWRSAGEDTSDVLFFEVYEFRAPEYLVVAWGDANELPSNTDTTASKTIREIATGLRISIIPDVKPYRAYLSEINGKRYLNVQSLGTSPIRYTFYEIEARGDSMVARLLDSAAHKFKQSGEVRAYLSAHGNEPDVYDNESKPLVLARVKLEASDKEQ